MGRAARAKQATAQTMKAITFNAGQAKNQKRLELLYGAVALGAQPNRGMEMIRREARLLDALDGVSKPNPDAPAIVNGQPGRTAKAGATLVLNAIDHQELCERVERVEWRPDVARDVVDVVDWLQTAKDVSQ